MSALKATPSSELNDLGGRFEALSSFIQRARKDDCTVTVGQSSDLQQSLLKGPPGSTPVLLERLAAKARFPDMYDLCRSRVEKGEVPEQVASSRILDVLGPPGAAKTTCVRSFTVRTRCWMDTRRR